MNQNNEKRLVAEQLIKDMKLCSHVIDEIIINSRILAHEDDVESLKMKAGEFLGSLYLDIYRKHLVIEFPEFLNLLESD